MRIVVAAVGRARQAPEDALCEAYLDRAQALGRPLGLSAFSITVVEASRAAGVAARQSEEAGRLTARLPPSTVLVALDAKGRSLSSEDFARDLAHRRDAGTRDLAFAIGGADGLAPSLKERAVLVLSFGAQTWPHLLARVMLAEQLYRACAILSGHPYHHGH